MTIRADIRRYEYGVNGTLGELWIGGKMLCHTLEDPDNNNAKGISCIPEGSYLVGPHSSVKYKDVWILRDVPGRTAILIHAGNTIEDTRGCILIGWKKGFINGLPAVLESRSCLQHLRKTLPKSFQLTITKV